MSDEGSPCQQTPVTLSVKKRILFSLVVVISFFCVAEITFRGLELIWPPHDVDLGLGFNRDSRVFVESPVDADRMETDRAKRVSFVRQRFQRDKPSNAFRIVALGGSSVNQLEPQFKRLENELSTETQTVEIINCGGFAYGSHRLVLVLREMLNYDPDLILLYTGHNEFEEVEQLSLSGVEHLAIERTISHSAIIRFIRDRRTDYEISRLEREHNQRLLSREEPVSETNFARAWSHDFDQDDVRERMESYEHNLRVMLTTAKKRDIPVIMGTVSSNLLMPYLPQEAATRYRDVYELWKTESIEPGLQLANEILAETAGRHQCSELENNILRRLADEFSVPLIDIESAIAKQEPHGIPGETLFDDHCHLNSAGRDIWASQFAPEIQKVLSASRMP
ncbi:SGNH/GDSL hydrolase family protein [Rhodopirellula sp. JC737]|nr:SGNH/GDSL hydrolase family protein [Rhodopirellula sp. JC737]